MPTLLIKKATGYTLDNLPDTVLGYAKQIDEGDDGNIQVQVDDDNTTRALDVLRAQTHQQIIVQRVNDSIFVDAQIADSEEVVQVIDNLSDEEIAEEEGTPIDDDEESIEGNMVDPATFNDKKIEGEAIYTTIAKLLNDDTTNRAKQLAETSAEFQRLWAQLIALKRNMELLSSTIKDNPIIKLVIDQAEKLKESNEFIEDVYFTDTRLIMCTGELITTDKIDGAKRLIGKMRIGISLSAFFSPRPYKTIDVLSIKNLTHRYEDGEGGKWECGHVRADGEICFGNTAFEYLFQAFVERDLDYIAEAIIRFIKEPNENDAYGSHIKYWPTA